MIVVAKQKQHLSGDNEVVAVGRGKLTRVQRMNRGGDDGGMMV